MGSRREEERNEKIIRGLMKLPPNRKCINCNSVGPQYVCTNFWTFVCLSCSGIHREFTHRVKSVSMSKFTTQEVRALEQGGNQRARDIYLKDWDWQRMRLPVNTNPDRIREFIRAVYVDKKYAGGSSNKPATDSESVKSNDNDMRRPSSYHSYSQSPPYDFQYEDRRYGKQVDTLARRPSDRALFDGKLGNLLFSPGRLRDQINEDRFANESSGSRFSDFSASSTADFRNDVLSPSSQETGYSSPSVHHSRNVSAENPQSQKYPSAASQIDFNGVRRSQRTASSGSFGSFDGISVSNKSIESGYPPDAPTEKPVHPAVNHKTVASPVAHSTLSSALPPNKSSINSSDHNLISQKPADLGGQTAPAMEPVQHGGVHIEAVVPSPVPAQPTTFTTLDLFDQSTVQQPVTSAAPIDLFAGFNEHSSVSHKTVDLSSHSDVAKEPAHNFAVQKAVAPSFVPEEALTTSHPVHQDLFSLSILQEPPTSSPPEPKPIYLFAGFDQQQPHMSSVQQIPSAAPLPANEGWAFFDAQHGSLMPVSNVQAQLPAAFPPTDGIAKGIVQSTLPTSPPNAIGSQSSPAMMDNWSLNAEEVKISVPKENSQSWNAFGESTQRASNDLFTFNTISQVAPHQFTTPGAPHVGSRTPQDLARGEPERSTPGDMFSGFNVSPGDMAGPSFPAALQPHLGGIVSHPGKSTNPFDMAFESDDDANNMFMDLTSLQETLPDPHAPTDYPGSFTEPWVSQNTTLPYIPSGPQGGLSYMAGQDSHMLKATAFPSYDWIITLLWSLIGQVCLQSANVASPIQARSQTALSLRLRAPEVLKPYPKSLPTHHRAPTSSPSKKASAAMHPFHRPRPNPNHPHRGRPGGDPGPAPLPAVPMQHPQLNHPAFPPPVPNLAAAANPMAAAAAANPFLALQLLGQAQQLQNLGFLAAAALQQQQQTPFFQGGFPPNPNQFAPFPGPHAGFNGGGAFRPGGAGVCGPWPPRPMMSPVGKGCNNTGVGGGGAPRPMPNVGRKDRNSSGGSSGEVNHSENKADGISYFASENGVRNKTTDQKARFNSGRDGRDGRQFGASRGRGRGRHFNQGCGRGGNNRGEIKSNFMSHGSPAPGDCSDIPAPASGGRRKRPPTIYDANEVKQWVEARKKNYPTSVNINKKLSQSQSNIQNKDKDAQMRRQELKEVLAKQQELGFELPELPPGYLSETEDQGNARNSKWKTQRRDCRFGNRTNDKRSRYDRGNFRSKRPKVWSHTPRDDGTMSREPTLLQKLLSSDIKRDRHRLLHTFKFMALNNFFKDWPDKDLEFPSVKVNQIEIENNIAADDLQNAETVNDSSLDLKENGDGKELSSIDTETGSPDHNEEEDEDGTSAESSDEKDGNEDAYEEQCNESEDDAAA
ncbi:uncharacterized protein LOC133885382 [Phragmites australis]|uniref:uncharacterized protein LOC133885382 n=1 Tax=Phragmites australis TaxID=29695 RepID=UPI002D789A5B|nr:uncharacterized protein LOC133885382 [Phragmites australis]